MDDFNTTQLADLYNQKVDKNKRSYASFCNQSAAKFALSQFDEALSDACRAMTIRNDGPKGYEMKANILVRMGRYSEAFQTYVEGLSYSPTNPILQKGLREFLVNLVKETFHNDSSPEMAYRHQLLVEIEEPHENQLEQRQRLQTLPSPPRELVSQSPLIDMTKQQATQKALECPVCNCCIVQPTLLPCGHTLCLDCLKDLTFSERCPVCEKKIPSSYQPVIGFAVASFYENRLPLIDNSVELMKNADLLCEEGNYAQALPLYSTAIQQCPKTQLFYIKRSYCFMELGNLTSAVSDAAAALLLQPLNGLGQLALANAYLHQPNFSCAFYFAAKAESLSPNRNSPKTFFPRLVSSFVSLRARCNLEDILSVSSFIPKNQVGSNGDHQSVEISETDIECQLCFNIFFDPITTSCGHSFCRNCISRALERSPHCPFCRTSISVSKYYRRNNTDRLLDRMSWVSYPEAYRERLAQSLEKEKRESTNIPIFVCTMAFPKVKCPLLIFEPRYKLMLKRCLESDRPRFGMCLPSVGGGYLEVGVMLEILDTKERQDGNIVVDCVGSRRFRVLRRSIRDEYNIADIQFFEDEDDIEDEVTGEAISLVQRGTDYVETARSNMTEFKRREFDTYYGVIPTDPSEFSLWFLAVLPIDSYEKYHLLSTTDCLFRLRQLNALIEDSK